MQRFITTRPLEWHQHDSYACLRKRVCPSCSTACLVEINELNKLHVCYHTQLLIQERD